MRNAGTETLVIKRLSDDRHDWIGSIVVDYAQPTNIERHTSRVCCTRWRMTYNIPFQR